MKWTSFPLSEVAKIVGGGTPSKSRPDFWVGDIPWVSPKDMKQRDIRDTEDHITEDAIAESATQIIPAGSVLIVVRSGILVRRFPVSVARIPVALNQDMKALIPHKPLVSDFLAFFLEASSRRILTQFVKRGATVHSVDVGKLLKLPVPVPARSEQLRIVGLCNQAKELGKKQTEVDILVARGIPALFYEIFGDPATNPKRWRMAKLGDCIAETQYGTSVRSNDLGDGVPVIRMNNIDSAGFLDLRDLKHVSLADEEQHRLLLEKGDILFNRTNSRELVGKTGLWCGEIQAAVSASYLIRVRVNQSEVRPEYVWALLNTPFMKQSLFNIARRAIGMANINAEELRALPILIPPMEIQEVFTTSLAGLKKLRTQLMERSTKAEALFSVLLQRAFSGDLTAKWRQVHSEKLLAEVEQQAKLLNVSKEALLC